MRFSQCKCGGSQYFGSDPPPGCSNCSKCGTGPGGRKPKDHKFDPRPVETDDGPAMLSHCRFCHLTKGQIAKRAALYAKADAGEG